MQATTRQRNHMINTCPITQRAHLLKHHQITTQPTRITITQPKISHKKPITSFVPIPTHLHLVATTLPINLAHRDRPTPGAIQTARSMLPTHANIMRDRQATRTEPNRGLVHKPEPLSVQI
jgi:hypothetical protein